MHVEELADILAFDFEVESTPRFRAERRSNDPVHTVLSTCSSLLTVVHGMGFRVVQFAHFSVKEYLTSKRLSKAKDNISRFHVSTTSAHSIIAQACLGILLHLDDNITRDGLKDFSLAEYAAKHCVDHARIGNASPKVQDGMRRLFDPRKHHLSVWVWIYDPEEPWRRSRRPVEARATPLHYATVYNMHDIATFLIVEHSQDVNARGFDEEETPLHVSTRLGHVESARVLLKHGADTDARDDVDASPLERAAHEGRMELARVLLELGTNANSHDFLRWTPLHWASEVGQLAVAQVLLSHGADVTSRCKKNETPLHRASSKEVAQLLLRHGADANALDIKNRTPLHRVSGLGRVGAALALLEHGVDANARDSNNATPLHLASISVYPGWRGQVVRLLLRHGSDIHARDREGRTPFTRARAAGIQEIVKLLLKHRAEDHGVMTTEGQEYVA